MRSVSTYSFYREHIVLRAEHHHQVPETVQALIQLDQQPLTLCRTCYMLFLKLLDSDKRQNHWI